LVSTTKSKKNGGDHCGRSRAEGHCGNAPTGAHLALTIHHFSC
jgi:uncharacterized low-complexity protein